MTGHMDLLIRLGRELEHFGHDDKSLATAREAAAANPWFTVNDIIFAVDAIRRNMLAPEIINKWLSRYTTLPTTPRRIALIMAGNIPLVGFSDLMCILAAGCIPCIKFSSKDTILMRYITNVIQSLSPDTIIETYSPTGNYDGVIATGSDNTGRYFRNMFAGLPTIIRGTRGSAAILTGNETQNELAGLREDMFRYSGLGCRNVSVLLMPKDCDAATIGRTVAPDKKQINQKYLNNYRSVRGRLFAEGISYIDTGTFVMTEGDDFPTALSNITVCRYKTISDAYDWLTAHEERLQCVVGRNINHPRATGFGHAQFPYPWDYPDGIDVMEFISSL